MAEGVGCARLRGLQRVKEVSRWARRLWWEEQLERAGTGVGMLSMPSCALLRPQCRANGAFAGGHSLPASLVTWRRALYGRRLGVNVACRTDKQQNRPSHPQSSCARSVDRRYLLTDYLWQSGALPPVLPAVIPAGRSLPPAPTASNLPAPARYRVPAAEGILAAVSPYTDDAAVFRCTLRALRWRTLATLVPPPYAMNSSG